MQCMLCSWGLSQLVTNSTMCLMHQMLSLAAQALSSVCVKSCRMRGGCSVQQEQQQEVASTWQPLLLVDSIPAHMSCFSLGRMCLGIGCAWVCTALELYILRWCWWQVCKSEAVEAACAANTGYQVLPIHTASSGGLSVLGGGTTPAVGVVLLLEEVSALPVVAGVW